MNLLILFCLGFILFSYAGYPLWLLLRARVWPRPWRVTPLQPPVTVIIAARNEAARIRTRLDNIRCQTYPADRIEVMVVSDASTDTTVDEIRQVRAQWTRLGYPARLRYFTLAEHCGKCAAINAALEHVRTDIVVFADMRQRFEEDAIARLVENFSDPAIGAVSGLLRLRSAGGEREPPLGLYWRLESLIRRKQSATGSVMGVTGAIYAMQRALFRPLPEHMLVDDLYIPLQVMSAGRRVVLDGRAVAWDEIPATGSHEFRRKVRTLTGVWQCLPLLLSAGGQWRLMPRFFAHKLSRLLVPWFLLLLLLATALSGNPLWQSFALVQLAGYGLAAATPFVAPLRRMSLFRTAHFFLLLNLAAAQSLFYALRGGQRQLWHGTSRRRPL